MTLRETIVVCLVALGAMFSLLAAIGLVRMPDLYTRMQSATKAGTLGVACSALATAVHFGTAAVAVEVLMVIVLFFLSAPVASHLIARAAYASGNELWKQTTQDDYGHDRAKESQNAVVSRSGAPADSTRSQ